MPCIAIVPVPNSAFGEDSEVIKEYTKLVPTMVFGREVVVDVRTPVEGVFVGFRQTLVSGISAYFECSKEEFNTEHPGAWFSDNPIAGHWYQLPKKEFMNGLLF